MSSKKSQDIEMSDLTFNGRKLKKGGKYLKKNGELRSKFQNNFKIYQNKLYNITGTKSFKFTGKKYNKNDIDYYDGLQLDNAYLINELIKRNGFTGETRIIIKKNNKIISDSDYDLDELKSGISEEFNDGQSPYKIYNRNLKKNDKIEIILAKSNKIPSGFYEQNFLDAIERHCFLSDIADYYHKMKEQKDEEGLCSKKATAILNKINGKKGKPGLLVEYSKGIPESKLNEVCDYLGIGIEINLPFQKEPLKSYRPSANNFYGKVFKYLNTRLNHLEHAENFSHTDIFYKSFDPTYVSFEELQEIVQDLLERNEYVAYKKGCFGITSAKTKDKYYLIDDEKTKAFSEFDNDTGLRWTKYDVIKYPLLKKFIDYGTHFNGTIDFKDTSELDSVIEVNGQGNIRHIDQEKAYSQFYHSQFYDGFMGKITDFRKHSGVAKVHGFYYVVNLDFSGCSEKFKLLNQKLVWFKNHNVYTKQELDCLSFHGGSYDTKFACFGVKIDFRFSDTMLNTKYTVKRAGERFEIPYYSLWTGTQASTKTKNNFYMKGDHKYFARYTQHDIWYNDESDETKIVFDNPICYSNKHISAQIVAYQRLVLLEQLMMLETDKIIRVCVDGIYVENHDFSIHHCFREKTAMTFRNSACDTYLSEIAMTENEDLTIQLNALPEARDYYFRELHRGAGGTGKSYKNLNDLGFIHGVYVPHSWKLASNVSGSVMKKLVHHSINHDDKINNWSKKYNVYFGDECSMMTEYDKCFWFKNIMGRIILMGDPECQLLPIYEKKKRDSEVKQDERRFKQMASTGFDYILDYNIVYRFNCSVLLNVTEKLRYFIKHPRKWNFNECKKILGFFNNIHITLLRDTHYDYKNDIILVARNKGKHSNEHYNEIFNDLDKFKVTENKFGYNNGDIVFEKVKGVRCEKRHGFTIHSVQGETYKNKIFIDLHHILEKGFIPYNDLRMFYTAVSRATEIKNIYLII